MTCKFKSRDGCPWKSHDSILTLDIRHYPSCTRVNSSTLRPTAPSTLLSPFPWHSAMYVLKREQTTRSPFAPACFLSPYHSKTLVSLVLNQVCHIRLFSFALRVFSMKWSTRLSVFRSFPFRSPTLAGLRRPLPLLCVSPHFPKEHRVISPSPSRRNAHFRVPRPLSSNFSISVTFDIGYELLLLSICSNNIHDSLFSFAFKY